MSYKTLFISAIVFACFLSFKTSAAETDYKKKLLEEIVEITDGKMTSLDFGLLSFSFLSDAKTQVKLYSEAPSEGVISRDNFVAITALTQASCFFGIAMDVKKKLDPKSKIDNPDALFDFEEIDEPIGRVDLEINIYMSKGGLQIEFIDTKQNKTDRHTMTWQEVLE